MFLSNNSNIRQTELTENSLTAIDPVVHNSFYDILDSIAIKLTMTDRFF